MRNSNLLKELSGCYWKGNVGLCDPLLLLGKRSQLWSLHCQLPIHAQVELQEEAAHPTYLLNIKATMSCGE